MSRDQSNGVANEDQIAFWNSAHGQKWVAFQEGLDAIHFAPAVRQGRSGCDPSITGFVSVSLFRT